MALEHPIWTLKDGDKGPVIRRVWLNPVKALHFKCSECVGPSNDYLAKITSCSSKLCPLYPYRSIYPQWKAVRELIPWKEFRRGQNLPQTHQAQTPSGNLKKVQAHPQNLIRCYCILCVGSREKVRDCTKVHCPLWPFRTGMVKTAEKHCQELKARGIDLEDYEALEPKRGVLVEKQ